MITEYVPQAFRRSVMTDPIDCDSVWDTLCWAGRYVADADQHAHLRFTIGVYQLDSLDRAIRCGSEVEAAEAAAAFCLHVWGAASLVDASIDKYNLFSNPVVRWSQLALPWDPEAALQYIAALQRQYCYILTAPCGSIRRARIDKKAVFDRTACVCSLVESRVRPSLRAAGFESAMQMLLDAEWKR